MTATSQDCPHLVPSSCVVKIIDNLLHINDDIYFAKAYNIMRASSGHCL